MDNLENQAKAEALYKQLSQSNTYSDRTYLDYERCLELNPRHVLALWNLGRIYDGDYDYSGHGSYWDEFCCTNKEKAIDCFTRIIKIDPNFSEAYKRLGSIYIDSNRQKALQYFLQSIHLNPQDYKVLFQLGKTYYHLNKKQEAMVNFIKCIEHNQKDTNALLGLANIYDDQGNFKDAVKCLQKCLEIYPKCAEFYAQVGRIYDKMGNNKEARESYRKCNQLNSHNKQAMAYFQRHAKKDLKH